MILKRDYGQFIFNMYDQIFKQENLPDVLIRLIVWIYGEIGSDYYAQEPEKIEQISQSLMECLEQDLESTITYSWILSALFKLSTIPNIQNKNQIIRSIKQFQQSKNIELYNRSHDYEKMLPMANFIKKTSLVYKVDESLAFLNNFVQKALQKGAKKYTEKVSAKSLLQNLSQKPELNYQPYSVLDQKKNIREDGSESSGIRLGNTNNKWGSKGFIKEEVAKPQAKPAFGSTMGISSENFNTNGSDIIKQQQQQISSSNIAVVRADKNVSGQLGFGSDTFKQAQPQLQHYQQSQVVKEPPFTEKPKQIDPAQKEKQALANSLFTGLGGGSKQTSQKVVTQKQTATVQKQSQQQPITRQELNLLDLDQDDQPQVQSESYKESKQTLDQYEVKWEEYPEELQVNLKKTKIKNEQLFRQMIIDIKFTLIEVIGNEVICSGFQAKDNALLMIYGIFENNGDLELRIKAKNKQDKNDLLNYIKQYI